MSAELAQHPMAPYDAVEKVATLPVYPLADLVHAGLRLVIEAWGLGCNSFDKNIDTSRRNIS
jgi:hypothetical protein